MGFGFDIRAIDPTGARLGRLTTARGAIETPVFMPVGTRATVKSLSTDDLMAIGSRLILSNTYHLQLRPGADVIEALGGLHSFMNWPGALLTDSGGFQVMSLGALRRVDDDGVTFRSHVDGSLHRFTPESAIRAQEQIGADIVMAFDQCPALPATDHAVEIATERTHRWADRCLAARTRSDQALFGIIQGGTIPALRRESASFIASRPFDGLAIGGVSVGEPKVDTYQAVEFAVAELPPERPRYVMGVGAPEDLVTCVGLGIDMFDCVLPSRIARHGVVYTPGGRRSLRSASARTVDGPIYEGCDCPTCQQFSLAYLSHLFRAGELLVYRLATLHNLRYLIRLMEEARHAIGIGCFLEFRRDFLDRFRPVDERRRLEQRNRRPAHDQRKSASNPRRGL
ncbi:MAG TPA: tRNA guanosine(34) transglycosylase Tgt [Chloroflexota bacterium]|nr:tRNA guanosine(34) transglycosylase Tgt [Chloroflexota bacterium]